MGCIPSLYYLSIKSERDTGVPLIKLKDSIKSLLNNDKLLSMCEIGLTRNRTNIGNNDVLIAINGYLFVFRDLILGEIIKKILPKKVYLDKTKYTDPANNIDSFLMNLDKK